MEKERYLLELCRYVVQIPIRAGMAAKPDEWRWSSYKNTACGLKVPGYLTIDWVLRQFAERRTVARQLYSQFVAEGQAEPLRPLKKPGSRVFLGSENFEARMRDYLGNRQENTMIPRSQRYPGRPPLHLLFTDMQKQNRQLRNRQIGETHITYGYTLKEIAAVLDVHYSTVSKIASTKIDRRHSRS